MGMLFKNYSQRVVAAFNEGRLNVSKHCLEQLVSESEIATDYGKITTADISSALNSNGFNQGAFEAFVERRLSQEYISAITCIHIIMQTCQRQTPYWQFLRKLEHNWTLFAAAEFLTYQADLLHQQYENIVKALDKECVDYQDYLQDKLKEINITPQIGSDGMMDPTAFQGNARAAVMCKKYNKLQELRNTLSGTEKAEDKVTSFKAIYTAPETHQLLSKSTDSYWQFFFKKVGYLLYFVVTLGICPGVSPKTANHMRMWRPPEPAAARSMDEIFSAEELRAVC